MLSNAGTTSFRLHCERRYLPEGPTACYERYLNSPELAGQRFTCLEPIYIAVMERRKFLASIATVAGTTSLAGCGAMNNNGGGGDTPEKNGTSTDKEVGVSEDEFFNIEENGVTDDDEDALVVQNSRLVRTSDGAGVVGEVKNTGNETFTSLEVTATLYDESDDVLGEFLDNTEDEAIGQLEPGAVWDFEIWFDNADLGSVASYSLSASGTVGDGNNVGNGGVGNSTGNSTVGNSSSGE